jgi:CheY-like chemotaxis protein
MPGSRVLIVEDNPANAALASYVLEREGYDVRVAVNANEALATLESFEARLILLDIQLPGMDGLQLARRIKSEPRTRHIAIVALTAYAMKGDEARALEAGCDGYMSKPINTIKLPALVAKLLGQTPGQASMS